MYKLEQKSKVREEETQYDLINDVQTWGHTGCKDSEMNW